MGFEEHFGLVSGPCDCYDRSWRRRACGGMPSGCARCCSRASPTWRRARRSRRRSRPGRRSRAGRCRCRCCSRWSPACCAPAASASWPASCPSAGSLATYAARGLHPAHRVPGRLGLRAGRGADPAAGAAAARLHHGVDDPLRVVGYPANLWWPWAILGALIVLAAGLLRGAGVGPARHDPRRRSRSRCSSSWRCCSSCTRAATTPGRCSARTYTPSAHHGLAGVIGGSVFTVLAFGGFEGAAPLAEEARDPRRTIPRAVLGGDPRHRRAVRLHHLRRGRRLRARPSSPAFGTDGRRVVGGHGPRPCTGSSGSSCSWPSSTRRSPTPTPA